MSLREMYYRLYLLVFRMIICNNSLVKDIYLSKKNIKITNQQLVSIYKSYKAHWNEIDNFLYKFFSHADKDIFLRFLLKRFFGIDTAKNIELVEIEKAFRQVEKLYSNKKTLLDPIVFEFRGKKLKYLNPIRENNSEKELERLLLNYYEVTHTFFLIEYEKEGFNPDDGMGILDCGASHGDTALLFSVLYPNSNIYSFEYEDIQYSYLLENIKLNKISNVETIQTFLYSDSGEHFIDKKYRIVDKEYDGKSKNGKVQTLSIDDYVSKKSISNVGLIKLDIEGGEIGALRGAINTIKEQKPILYIPIYHLTEDIYEIPKFIHELNIPAKFSIKWTEKRIWGVDCVLFVRFIK